ncbi:glycoside hydrolase family 13 protein [Nocardioides sp. TRM66260-LWL]|uniref:glycoside hydrolase family 13 protein n=1 Tax=Nocardioides sp. TRM66260-LWL TaxID=2874478 RepID=UPI001CC7B31A|nr:glycoside hydrolase family 13 protein [Nocardioides sp. TRM66260-LWL]MBZ5734608.1 glycoside hydrolase family 13 protein [Nocardioides sp. TRM66260-LWL]
MPPEPPEPPHLLDEPHHDGSPLHLSDDAPALEDVVTVRVRTSAAPGRAPEAIWLRTTYDAEPVFHGCAETARDEHVVWWEGRLPVHNPVTHYRFLLSFDGGARQEWLTAAGVVPHDPPDAHDFVVTTHEPAPAWGREAIVYQVFPDRFARSAAADERPVPPWAVPAAWDDTVVFEGSDPRTPLQYFGGDLDGLVEHLDHLDRVGATVLYTTPVFPGESNHRYNASTFDGVDPLLGGDEAYARLAQAVHARGWRLLGDLTTNHTGDTHEWFRTAREGGPTRTWYHLRDDGGYETWMGHHTLPKLNLADPGLRAAMVEGHESVVARWLRPPFEVDGWRIDVANMTGRLGALDVNHDVARAVRATATAERPDAWVIGEHNHDASGDVDGDGWHGTMNYSGFSWPVWSWLRDPDSPARAFGRPLPVAVRPGGLVVRTLREWAARYGFRATAQSWSILGSHDSARIRTLTGSGPRQRVAAGLQFTLPGVPMVFAGDELGLEGVLGEDSRRPMPWHRPETWDLATLDAYAALATARREHPALVWGGLRWALAEDDAIAFLREHPSGTLLVLARRAPGEAVDLPAGPLGASAWEPVLGTEATPAPLDAVDGVVTLPAGGVGVSVWRASESEAWEVSSADR